MQEIKTINLVNKTLGSINYEMLQFSDGQQSIRVNSPIWKDHQYRIVSKMDKGWYNVEQILLATAYLKEAGAQHIELVVPYFIGARSDRKFTANSVNYMKTVIAPVINAQGYNKVLSLDPHSDVVEACINRFEKMDIKPFIKWALEQINNKRDATTTAFLAPDAGALKRVYDLAQYFNVSNVYTGEKIRNVATGEIVKTTIHAGSSIEEMKDIVIIDDICDGGRTFIEIANAIRMLPTAARLHLIVTHGIFSKGQMELASAYNSIFSTNTFVDKTVTGKTYNVFI